MASKKETVFMSGKVYWAKVIGAPRPNYGGDAREWTFEFEPDEKGLATLKRLKLDDRLKDKHEDRGLYLVLRKSELNKDGNPNTPIRIYDADNNEWDGNRLIGNGSDADVKLDVRDYGIGKKKGVYPVAIRVTELVPYQTSEFGGMDREEEAADAAPAPKTRKAAPKFEEELDDEIPF